MEQLGFDWSLFFAVLFLQEPFFDGIKLTIALALSVWVISIIAGFLLAEVKCVVPKVAQCFVNLVLWFLKSIPVLVLIDYCYILNFSNTYDYQLSVFFTAVFGISFWTTANMADIFYRYRRYAVTQFKINKTNPNFCIVLPDVIRFLATIITITPLIVFIGGKDFFAMVNMQLSLTYQGNELFLAAISVYLILTGIITLIAKVLEKILNVPDLA